MGIIVKPIVTEKMTKLGEKLNRYGFRVQKDANKIQIKIAVEAMYNVTAPKNHFCIDVNTELQLWLQEAELAPTQVGSLAPRC